MNATACAKLLAKLTQDCCILVDSWPDAAGATQPSDQVSRLSSFPFSVDGGILHKDPSRHAAEQQSVSKGTHALSSCCALSCRLFWVLSCTKMHEVMGVLAKLWKFMLCGACSQHNVGDSLYE